VAGLAQDDNGPDAIPMLWRRAVDAKIGVLDAVHAGFGERVAASAAFALGLQPAFLGEDDVRAERCRVGEQCAVGAVGHQAVQQ
jgi:hypothetical protein